MQFFSKIISSLLVQKLADQKSVGNHSWWIKIQSETKGDGSKCGKNVTAGYSYGVSRYPKNNPTTLVSDRFLIRQLLHE